MNISIKHTLPCILLIFLCIPLHIPTKALSQERDTLRVVYTTWYPYTYEKNGTASGFEIDIFKAVINTMGLKAEFQSLPWKRCLIHIKNGNADALISMLKTPEREEYTHYPQTCISISKTMLFTTRSSHVTFNGFYENLTGYNIGVIKGFSYGKAFDTATNVYKDPAFSPDMLVKKLLVGRNDLAIGNQAVINAVALNMKAQNKIKFLPPAVHTQKLYVGFSKTNGLERLGDAFSDALNSFKTTDNYKEILKQYGIEPTEMLAP